MILYRQKGESKDEYIIRFMNDIDITLQYPDFKERYEVCISNLKLEKPKRKRI